MTTEIKGSGLYFKGDYLFDPFSFLLPGFQSKKKFERECREAEKSQITFERLDNDINATKSDVERVRGVIFFWFLQP